MKKILLVLTCLILTSSAYSCGSNNPLDDASQANFTDEDWDFVKYKDKLKPSEAQKAEETANGKGYIDLKGDEKTAFLFSEPKENSEKLAEMKANEVVEVYDLAGDWIKIKYNDLIGYTKANQVKLLVEDEEVPPTETTTTEVVSTESASTTTVEAETTTLTTTEIQTTAENKTTAKPATTKPATTKEEPPVTTKPETLPLIVSEAWPIIQTTTTSVSQPDDISAEAEIYVYSDDEGYTYKLYPSGNYDFLVLTVTTDLYSQHPENFEEYYLWKDEEDDGVIVLEGYEGEGVRVFLTPYDENGVMGTESTVIKINPYSD